MAAHQKRAERRQALRHSVRQHTRQRRIERKLYAPASGGIAHPTEAQPPFDHRRDVERKPDEVDRVKQPRVRRVPERHTARGVHSCDIEPGADGEQQNWRNGDDRKKPEHRIARQQRRAARKVEDGESHGREGQWECQPGEERHGPAQSRRQHLFRPEQHAHVRDRAEDERENRPARRDIAGAKQQQDDRCSEERNALRDSPPVAHDPGFSDASGPERWALHDDGPARALPLRHSQRDGTSDSSPVRITPETQALLWTCAP